MKKARTAIIQRKTKEVQIRGKLNLDGMGKSSITTGIRFLDHMLELFAKHGLFDLKLNAKGDLDVDIHHTNEDLGLALGDAFLRALGNKEGIRRMGKAYVPMDESLARVVVDMSGRPYFRWDWSSDRTEDSYRRGGSRYRTQLFYDLDDAKHWLESFVAKSEITLHVDVFKSGEDIHHLLESVFKALGRALREAVDLDSRVRGVPSTKGKL